MDKQMAGRTDTQRHSLTLPCLSGDWYIKRRHVALVQLTRKIANVFTQHYNKHIFGLSLAKTYTEGLNEFLLPFFYMIDQVVTYPGYLFKTVIDI